MNITINHRCGTTSEWWAPSDGGYVRRCGAATPGTLGRQPAINGVTLMCGASEESLRHEVRRYLRHLRSGEDGCCYCTCGLGAYECERRVVA
jgi:hypothetical protein